MVGLNMASQNHRPGASISISPTAYSKDKIKRVENLETQLLEVSTKSKQNEEHASRLRMQLCEILSDILLTDPEFATKNDCIGRLWRGCFYGPIGLLRQRISREKKKKDSPNMTKLHRSLNTFISEAITLYEYLVSQYHAKLLGKPDGATVSPGPQQSSQPESQAIKHSLGGIVSGLYRMYIHVGDLYRYDSKYKEAQQFYGNASKLSPGRGNPYNQIAVVAQLKDAAAPLNAVALYWYARSLLATHEPFEISKANLARLLQSNRDWFHKQPPPPDDATNEGNGGREMLKSQRSVASRHFLSQFVDLHFSFFQGIGASANKGPTAQQVVTQIKEALTPLAVLLRNSAFGDPLLCKMVAICAFSESYRPNEDKLEDSACTKYLARIFILSVGSCLAERAAVGLAKIKDQPGKMGNPGKAPSSVRLLLPLLLVCEYVESSPIDTSGASSLSERTLEFCDKAIATFWQKCIEVLNILKHLCAPLNLDIEEWKNSNLKEFDSLVGFTPFAHCLKDEMSSSRQEGFASIEEAVQVLQLKTSKKSLTQDSVTGSAASAEEYKVKVARLLAFGDRMAGDSVDRRFGRNTDGSYAWKETQDGKDDGGIGVGQLLGSDTQPPVKAADDILVYSVPKGGGPKLLVPGMLLQSRAMGNGASGTASSNRNSRSSSDESYLAPLLPFRSPAVPATQPTPTLAGRLALAGDPQAFVPPGRGGVMPPPGFRSQRLAAVLPTATAVPIPEGHAAKPQNQIPLGENFGMVSHCAPIMSPQGARRLAEALPIGLPQGDGSVMPQQQQSPLQQNHKPAIASSMRLFGGPEALKTANPFATASMPPLDGHANTAYMGLIGAAPASGNGGSLLNPSTSSVAESSLLGSGLLHSLFEDSGDKTSKNPFAT